MVAGHGVAQRTQTLDETLSAAHTRLQSTSAFTAVLSSSSSSGSDSSAELVSGDSRSVGVFLAAGKKAEKVAPSLSALLSQPATLSLFVAAPSTATGATHAPVIQCRSLGTITCLTRRASTR